MTHTTRQTEVLFSRAARHAPFARRGCGARGANDLPRSGGVCGACEGRRPRRLDGLRETAILIALGALSACSSSPPMRYYTLSVATLGATAQGSDISSAPAGAAVHGALVAPVFIGRITIPGDIDRTQLVNRIDANRLQISDRDRWAAPLDEMIRRTLSTDLAMRLPPGSVSNLGASPPGTKRQVLALDIQEFHGAADCSVTLRAAWTLTRPDSQSSVGSASIQAPSSGACPESLAIGMSRALAELADHIAPALSGDAKLSAP